MSTDFRATKFEQAARDGCKAAGMYDHAVPSGPVLNAILNGLDAAGLLLTDDRLDQIRREVEDR